MNRRLLAAVVVMSSLLTYAPVTAGGTVRAGIAVGLSFFKIHETSSEESGSYETSNRTGLVAGGVLDIPISKLFSIEPGLAFSMRGAHSEATFTEYDYYSGQNITYHYEAWLKFNYIAIPVHAILKYPTVSKAKPYVLAGINTAILLSARDKEEATGEPSTDEDVKSHINPLDFGIDIGAGMEFDLNGVIPFVELGYTLGIANIAKNDTGEDFSITNKGFAIQTGIKFKR
jgi:hypothetical protein